MSLADTHFALGTALTLLLVRAATPRVRYRTTIGVLGASGHWFPTYTSLDTDGRSGI